MILVKNLTHRYGDRIALSNVGFEVKKGEIFGLLGPNGGGKSTLFRILSTMMVPTAGQAIIAGHDVVREAAEVRRHIGVVFQTQSLDKALTVEENLRAQGHLHGLSGVVLRERRVAVATGGRAASACNASGCGGSNAGNARSSPPPRRRERGSSRKWRSARC